MSRNEWIGVGLLFAGALMLLVIAVLVRAWNTDPQDVIRKTEDKRRPKENLARDVDLTNRHFDLRRANDLTVRLPRKALRAEPTERLDRHDKALRQFHQAGGYE